MRDSYVRSAASSALGQVVKAAPAEQVLPSLIEAMRDNNWRVRRAAIEALGEIFLQQLIEGYWATQDQALIPLIASQLYHTPLLVRNSPAASPEACPIPHCRTACRVGETPSRSTALCAAD